ncbi:MAG: S8 family peptidase, partial [Acidobacteria bacterium]|nr:S8 family peptidase [Acidobacteriota bacterium]
MESRRQRLVASVRLLALAVAVLVGVASSAQAAGQAGGHRARLSADLHAHLSRASAASVDVIVTGDRAKVEGLAARHGIAPQRLLRAGAIFRLTQEQLGALSEDPELDHLSGDVAVYSTMAVTNEAIGADQVRAGLEGLAALTGRGVGIAIIDSGIARHPAIRNRIVATVDFTAPHGQGTDQYGHGTHVAGIVAAADPAAPEVTRFTGGVAPGAHLVNLRVIGEDGSGRTSDVIEAIDWAIENRARYRLRVINLSLGHPVLEPYADDPLCQAVERASAAGLVVVAAAGNLGKLPDGTPVVAGIESPGNSPFAITVGALNTRGTAARSDDAVATYSSRGPTPFDHLLKPDLVAPGNRVVSLEAPGSYLATTYPDRRVAGSGRYGYFELSGTSMATAVVSGTVALVLESNPRLDPLRVKVALQLGSTFLPDAGL